MVVHSNAINGEFKSLEMKMRSSFNSVAKKRLGTTFVDSLMYMIGVNFSLSAKAALSSSWSELSCHCYTVRRKRSDSIFLCIIPAIPQVCIIDGLLQNIFC